MPKHSSKNYYKAEAEVSDTSVSFLDLERENDGLEYTCFDYTYLTRGCNCSECRESRKRKKELEIVEKEFTAEQMLTAFIHHIEEDKCFYAHTDCMKDLQKKMKQWYYKESKKKNNYAKPFEGLEFHASDLPSCVIELLLKEYKTNLQEHNRERNWKKREQKRKQKGICDECMEWTSV